MVLPPHPPPPSLTTTVAEYKELEASLLASPPISPAERRAGCSYLNSGAFGEPPGGCLELKTELMRLCYEQPMVYHRDIVPLLMREARGAACDLIGIPESLRSTFSFQPVTSAIFTVLLSFAWSPSDVVVTTDVVYHSVRDALMYLEAEKGIKWKVVKTAFGSTCEERGENLNSFLTSLVASGESVKLVVFDAVSSKPALRFPVPTICSHCVALGIPTLVDAAHVPGVGLDPSETFDPCSTFWVCTFHKWLGCPRGASGGMWVNLAELREEYPEVDTSRLVEEGRRIEGAYVNTKPGILTDGMWQGVYDESTREYENIIVLPFCIKAKEKRKGLDAWREARREGEKAYYGEVSGLGGAEMDTWRVDEDVPVACLTLPEQLKGAGGWKEVKKELVRLLWDEFSIGVESWSEAIATYHPPL